MKDAQFTWRKVVTIEDAERVCALVHATGKFSAEEIAIAGELVKERVQRGPASGYEFVLVEDGAALLGYACFGPIPGSDISYDLYWIAVVPERQGEGLGQRILARAEETMREAGARRVYVDTSTTEQYRATRTFYSQNGYELASELADFYRLGDGKAIFLKVLPP